VSNVCVEPDPGAAEITRGIDRGAQAGRAGLKHSSNRKHRKEHSYQADRLGGYGCWACSIGKPETGSGQAK
jgi:hypothetical protein